MSPAGIPATLRPAAPVIDGGPVVRRNWLVKPDPDGVPLLTGLYGYPWPEPFLDARCLHTESAAAALPFTTATTGRHHPIVPDPGCTCGIYAHRDPFASPPPARSHPSAGGFVELHGRVLAEPGRYRARRARIVGPLVVSLPPPPLPLRPFARFSVPRRVLIERDRYRISWRDGRGGLSAEEWRRDVAAALEVRYGVAVISLPAG